MIAQVMFPFIAEPQAPKVYLKKGGLHTIGCSRWSGSLDSSPAHPEKFILVSWGKSL